MCGICGFNWRDPELGKRMASVIAHRGPDQDGIWCDEHVTLGHRRLSIIDLSEAGRQPMPNEDDGVQVVFNGEIYNFAEIRKELEAKGLEADDKTSVHPSTLASFVREKLRDGQEIPLDVLGVHRQRISKIKS